jgi:hypothetical protein
MKKEIILKAIALKIRDLEAQAKCVHKIKINTFYKMRDIHVIKDKIIFIDTYGYFECLNIESARFMIIASDQVYLDYVGKKITGIMKKTYPFTTMSKEVSAGFALIQADITLLSDKLTTVPEEELPLLVGMKYKSPELEKVLKGKKKLKYA